ncbi:MAG: hypothetical protein M3Q39_00850 [Actinomycetota bacterium]|jgi:hypothetical protein|nr:hypothetical protein [Actinomycetota bacterium]
MSDDLVQTIPELLRTVIRDRRTGSTASSADVVAQLLSQTTPDFAVYSTAAVSAQIIEHLCSRLGEDAEIELLEIAALLGLLPTIEGNPRH